MNETSVADLELLGHITRKILAYMNRLPKRAAPVGVLNSPFHDDELFFAIYYSDVEFEKIFTTHVGIKLNEFENGFSIGFVTLPDDWHEDKNGTIAIECPGMAFDGVDEDDFVQAAGFIQDYLFDKKIPNLILN